MVVRHELKNDPGGSVNIAVVLLFNKKWLQSQFYFLMFNLCIPIQNEKKIQLPAIESIIQGLTLLHEKEENKLRSALTDCLFQVLSSKYSSLMLLPEKLEFKEEFSSGMISRTFPSGKIFIIHSISPDSLTSAKATNCFLVTFRFSGGISDDIFAIFEIFTSSIGISC